MKNEKVNEYILSCEPFIVPALKHLRDLIHTAIPAVEENIKWNMPSFEFEGKIICSFAGFKKHGVLRFYNGKFLKDTEEVLLPVGEKSNMAHIGNFKEKTDLPSDEILLNFIKQALEIRNT